MTITKEQAAAIAGEDSEGLIIIKILADGKLECAAASHGRIHPNTLVALGQTAAQAIRDAMETQPCLCPKCSASRALSGSQPIAQA